MTIGHIVYKADDLSATIENFRAQGFEVEEGQGKDPSNALVYFREGPYLEIRSGVTMPAFSRHHLRLMGKGRVVDGSDAVASLSEGYRRVVFDVERRDFARLKAICRERGVPTVTAPASRKDARGRTLSCWCLSPADWSIPMFVTRFATDTHRRTAHPNGITRMDQIVFEGTPTAIGICREAGVDDLLTCEVGHGGIQLEYV
ncbi:MAG: VOC family protein [Brachybacterium sp.]|uniref:VOC family protein n=1 Tax=Brachybacterium sp. AOP35-5H-19 TaxID=3457685 RepID=UPI003FB96E92